MRLARTLAALTGALILAILALLRPILPVRLGMLHNPKRIGHLLANTETWLRRRARQPKQRGIDILIAGPQVANEQVAAMIARRALLVRGRVVEYLAYHTKRAFPRAAAWIDLSDQGTGSPDLWSEVAPQLAFTAEEDRRGRALLTQLGLDPDRPYVCFGTRDSTYLDHSQGGGSWAYHDYRNSNIADFLPAMTALAARGIGVVRMGAAVAAPLPDHLGVVDYASHHRCEFGDVWLMAHCRFFVGDSAGLNMLAFTFDVPCALANMVPLAHCPWGSQSLYIPKTYRRADTGARVGFGEIAAMGGLGWTRSEDFRDAGLEVVSNTPGEIADLVEELEARLDGTWHDEPDADLLQARFRALFPVDHPASRLRCRLGARFLSNNQDLLP